MGDATTKITIAVVIGTKVIAVVQQATNGNSCIATIVNA